MNGKGKGKSEAAAVKDSGQRIAAAHQATTQQLNQVELSSLSSNGRALAGRVKRLNELAGQHLAVSRQPSKTSSSGVSSGRSGGGNSGRANVRDTFPTVPQHAILVKSDKFARFVNAKTGREIAKAKIVAGNAPFVQRMKQVSHPTFTQKAVGLSESQVYHGSSMIKTDFVRDGQAGTRLAGSQYLDVVENTSTNAISEGSRLTFVLVSPKALGGVLARMSKQFEQAKANQLRIVYKPVVPATTAGAIAFYFKNDTQDGMYDVGLDELQAAATHPYFTDTTVWTPISLDIKPSDALKKYFDEASGGFLFSIEGIITVLASSSLEASKIFGHLYLEYDFEFFAAELDNEIDEVDNALIRFTWGTASNPYVAVAGAALSFQGGSAAATAAKFQFITGQPPDVSWMAYGVTTLITQLAGGVVPDFATNEDMQTHSLAPGQGFYIVFEGAPPGSNWTNSSITAYIFADGVSAQDADFSEQDVQAGQLQYATTVNGTATMEMRVRMLAVDTED